MYTKGCPILSVRKPSNTILRKSQPSCFSISSAAEKLDFLYFRTILMTPSEHRPLFDLVKASPKGKDVEFVDPYTLFLLIKQASASKT